MTDRRIDLVTFGEAMLRLTPPAFQRLEQASSLDLHVGGAELNVAVAASRLGVPARWVSRLTESAIGRLVASRAREHDVDVSCVQWTPDDRVGVYFAELGAAPRASNVLYDRSGSAISRVKPGTIDWRQALEGARWFHVSGITPALSESAANVTAEALEAAKGLGLTVSYDLNYRSKLWSADSARRVQEPLMRLVDVLITTEEDARVVFGIEGGHSTAGYESVDARSYEPVARALQDRFNFTAVAVTLRENPRVWLNTWSALLVSDDRVFEGPRFEVEVVDRIGAGDAFSGGLIAGRLATNDWESAVRQGTALGALAHTTPGDFSLSTREDVEQLLKGGRLRVSR